MNKAQRTAFVCCSLLVMGWMIVALFFPQTHSILETRVKGGISFLRDWRLSYNALIKNTKRAFELEDEAYERLINTSYTLIYKREYEALKNYMGISEQMDLVHSIHTGALVNTIGTGESEILRIVSDRPVAQKGYLVSPSLSAVIGKIISSWGKTADVIPIWNADFSAQVTVKDFENESHYPDLALIEDQQVINFNPAFPYKEGDGIYISEYEPGGYTLSRYEWTGIGQISAVKHNEIVEKYSIEYDYTREEILKERYFFIVE